MREVWVAGHSSDISGAAAELDHLIDLLTEHGVTVNLVPMAGLRGVAPADRQNQEQRGCHWHDYHPGVFADRVVLAFGNGRFLTRLPQIAAQGRPRRVLWFNCNVDVAEQEKTVHRLGLIDLFGCISEYQRRNILPPLEAIAPVRQFEGYRPYLNLKRAPFRYREWQGSYHVGRISRDDILKYPGDTWRMFDRVLTPPDLRKKVFMLGCGANGFSRIGAAPRGLEFQTWPVGAMPAGDFYRQLDTMMYMTGGWRESYGRVLVEAYAHGVVAVVQRDFAFPELVSHGETGFLAASGEEMSYYATWLAMHPRQHRRIAAAARRQVERMMDAEKAWRPWDRLFSELEREAGTPVLVPA